MKPLTSAELPILAEINVTPFTDVLLVLLVIFMILAALATPPGFQKQMTSPAGHGPPPLCRHQIDISVRANGSIWIEGRRIALAALYPEIASTVRFHDDHTRQGYCRHIALLGDSKTDYNLILKVLDAARAAQDDDVGLVVQH